MQNRHSTAIVARMNQIGIQRKYLAQILQIKQKDKDKKHAWKRS